MLVEPIPKQGKAKKKPRKRKSETDAKACDRLAGSICRSIGMCESGRLDHKGSLQWAHGFPRTYRTIRWDPRNSWCLCAGCHMYYTQRPIEWELWMKQRLGLAVYDELQMLAVSYMKVDMKALRAELTALWSEIERGT